MSAWREHFGQLARQRMPFLPLLAAAVCGCLTGHYFPEPAGWLAGLAPVLLIGAVVLAGRHVRLAVWVLGLGVVTAFAAMHSWREHSSVARQIAEAWPGPVIVDVHGVVAEVPRAFAEDRSAFRIHTTWVEFPGWSGKLEFPLQVAWSGAPPQVGDQIAARGTLSQFPAARNPGAFDLKGWMASRGIFSRLEVNLPSEASVRAARSGFSLQALAGSARQWAQRTLTVGLEADSSQAHLITAMTLGDTRPLDDALLEGFRGTGTLHLFSVSGLHVGIVGFLFWLVLSTLGVPRAGMVAVIIPVVFFYALVTGWKPASVRAAVMASFVLVGLLAGRPPVVLNSLLAAAFFLLLTDTQELFNPGFQLSFSVVASLVLLCGPLGETLAARLRPDPFLPPTIYTRSEKRWSWTARTLAPLAAVAVAAWIGSAILTLGYFHLISFSAVPANMLCVPLAFCVMAVAMLSLTTGLLSLAVAAVFNNANWLLASILIAVVEGFAALPGSYFYVAAPAFPQPVATITIFDFGKGGAVFVEGAHAKWLIDCGPSREHDRSLLPFLRSRGVNRLDGLVLTHGDASHIGAAEALLESCAPQSLYESVVDDRSPVRRRVRAGATKAGLHPQPLKAGDSLEISDAMRLSVLFPPPDLMAEWADDKALVLLLDIQGRRVLMLSDAGPGTEAWLLQHVPHELECAIVIKGAHHSGVAMLAALLDAANPAALIATGDHFPSTETLPEATLLDVAQRGIALYRQDVTGAVTIQFWPDEIRILPFLTSHSAIP